MKKRNAFWIAVALALVFFFQVLPALGQDLAYLQLKAGWNLKGNSYGSTINMEKTFGNFGQNGNVVPGVTAAVVSVWKWNAYAMKWAFYTTRMDANYLASYAVDRGYNILTDIYPGEGFWVFVSSPTVIWQEAYPADYLLANLNSGGLATGFNLVAFPVPLTPSNVAAVVSPTPPTPSDMSGVSSVTTIWAWDTEQANWNFSSPSLEKSCGLECVRDYLWRKGYLEFPASKNIERGEGVWINFQPQQFGAKG